MNILPLRWIQDSTLDFGSVQGNFTGCCHSRSKKEKGRRQKIWEEKGAIPKSRSEDQCN